MCGCYHVEARRRLVLSLMLGLILLQYLDAEARMVRVGVFPAAPLVQSGQPNPSGLFIDMIEYFAHVLDWRVEYVNGTWSELLVSLQKGDIDLLPAVGYTDARTAIYDFSRNPVFVDSGVVFGSSRFPIHTVFDLQGKRVAGVAGSTFTNAFIAYAASFGVRCDIVLTKDNPSVMRSISNGSVDAGICIYSLGTELARRFPVAITAITFSPIALDFAVPKGRNQDLIAGIDRLMAPMINDPDSLYSRSYNRWMLPQPAFVIPLWVWWGIGSLFVLGLILGLWSITLRKQVFAKTRHLEAEISERSQAEENLRASLREKESLLRELYHRTKNNMAVINALLGLQAGGFSDARLREAFAETQNRIFSMALVHEKLYEAQDLSRINLKEYIRDLAGRLMVGYGISPDRATLVYELDDVPVLIDTAIPCGLILNELISNALKYAFPDGRKGEIRIVLHQTENGEIRLEVGDDGVGVPRGFDVRRDGHMGLQTVLGLAESQLGAAIDFDLEHGFAFTMRFMDDSYRPRV
jgi:two-component sensor histidine kinase/ABC-type amino acid transport substrate-binding protein